jgi:hypothetical protein
VYTLFCGQVFLASRPPSSYYVSLLQTFAFPIPGQLRGVTVKNFTSAMRSGAVNTSNYIVWGMGV